MKFKLDFLPTNPGFEISHQDAVFLIGSCFSENIGNFLQESRFKIVSNPYGILFNPHSIAACLNNLIDVKDGCEDLFLQRDGIFYSYACHSRINAQNKQELQKTINHLTESGHQHLKKSKVLIITFGTAYGYEHNVTKTMVANCHKQPQALFTKKLLTVNEIITIWKKTIKQLSDLNPNLKIIFTVSPVKHLQNGVVENNLSKATLLLATHELVNQFNHCSYFPAFELVNDDLRDYRFYKEDMAHPNEVAIKYVWEKFSDCFFNSITKEINEKARQLHLALNHKKTNTETAEDKALHSHIQRLLLELKNLLPDLN